MRPIRHSLGGREVERGQGKGGGHGRWNGPVPQAGLWLSRLPSRDLDYLNAASTTLIAS